jgi:hypothetical protein
VKIAVVAPLAFDRASDTRTPADREAATPRTFADKRAADYKVAIEKCDALTGAGKDACVSNAKVQYGKS